MVWRYQEINGRVEKRIVHSRDAPLRRGEPRPDRHFSETLLRAYYRLECEEGSRFRSNYSKNQIKRVHDNALRRYEATGQEV
jgi:hypothetical protein